MFFIAGTGNSIQDLLFALLRSACTISAGNNGAACGAWGA